MNTIEKNSIIKDVFVPVYNDSGRIFHRDQKDHEKFHNIQIPLGFEFKSSSTNKDKQKVEKELNIKQAIKINDNSIKEEQVKKTDHVAFRQETVKNVIR